MCITLTCASLNTPTCTSLNTPACTLLDTSIDEYIKSIYQSTCTAINATNGKCVS